MTTETTPNTSAGQGAPLPVSQSSLKPANGKRKRALLILLVVALLVGTVLLVGLLNYVPALALGPVVEHLQLQAR